MKVIICGAGQVGANIASYLAKEGNDITVIDQNQEMLNRIGNGLDIRCVLGAASHPSVLERAGAEDADMIIAVSMSDEVNMLACQVADSLFGVTHKIARVRHQNYLLPIWANLYQPGHLPINVIISPEIEVARAIMRRIRVPGATDVIPMAGDLVRLIGVRCTQDTPLINTPLRQLRALFPDLNIVVIMLVRDGRTIMPLPENQILIGDEVLFVIDSSHLGRAMSAFGCEETESRRIVILGGGKVGYSLAQEIERTSDSVSIKVIEQDKKRAEEIADSLRQAVVINGNALDRTILDEAGIAEAEIVVAVTDNDETNIISSLIAKKQGGGRVIALANRQDYRDLMTQSGIDVVVSPSSITVSTVIHCVRRGKIRAVHSIREGFGELIEAEVTEFSPLVGWPVKDMKLPAGVLLGAIVRNGEIINPRGTTIAQTNDRVILFAPADSAKKIDKLFPAMPEFL